jgi:aminomethyltransferase
MAFVIDATDRPRVLVRGRDGPAFIHRLSTQHVHALAPGEARLNTLTTDKGRIKDVVHHAVLDADTVLLVGHRLSGDDLCAWLDRYCFTEAATFEVVAGPCVLADAATADAVVPGAAGLAPWAMARHGDIVALRTFDRVDAAGAAVPAVLLVGLRADVALPTPDTAREIDDVAAMAAGVPVAEMGESHTPLDLELHDAIHWAKGCYIGQEVIARLDTYGKQRKRLVALVADNAIAAGEEIVINDAVVGTVTSAVSAPLSSTQPRALALVRLAADALPCTVVVRGPSGTRRATARARHAAQVPHD